MTAQWTSEDQSNLDGLRSQYFKYGEKPSRVSLRIDRDRKDFAFEKVEKDRLNRPLRVSVASQGHVLKVRVKTEPKKVGGARVAISGFTAKSKKRLIDHVLAWDVKSMMSKKPCSFLTLTYPKSFPTTKETKKHLKLFLQRLSYRAGRELVGVWKLEYQKRGAPHYHLLLFNMPFIHWSVIRTMWSDILGRPAWVDIRSPENWKHVMRYLFKYVCKSAVALAPGGAPGVAFQGGAGADPARDSARLLDSNANSTKEESMQDDPGRFWGIFGRENIIWGMFKSAEIDFNVIYYRLRRVASRFFKPVKNMFRGFTLYLDDPAKLVQWAASFSP